MKNNDKFQSQIESESLSKVESDLLNKPFVRLQWDGAFVILATPEISSLLVSEVTEDQNTTL